MNLFLFKIPLEKSDMLPKLRANSADTKEPKIKLIKHVEINENLIHVM